MTTVTLTPEPLTATAFAPFGQVIEAAPGHSFLINEGTTRRFHALATADTGAEDGRPILSIFRATARPRPIRIRMVERHPLGSQAFMPLVGHPWLVVVAAGDRPGPADCRAFRAAGGQGIQYARGVWHHPLLVLEPEQDFLVVDRDGPGGNLDELWFAEGTGAVVADT